jgi:branched-chain amino acid transport system substrate-binding protein
MTVQQRDSIPGLIAALHQGSIDRRSFMRRAAGAGLSAALIGSVVARYDSVSAQDASPAAGTVAQDIGLQNVEHVTDTSKGTIKLYSSWPLTGGMERTGNDAVAAFQMALEDFGGAAGGFALTYEALDDGVAANNGGWEAGKETENVNRVINDPDAVVYIATYNSGAAKISIPITNEAGMAQVSYANTYTGLTRALEGATEEGEPDIYYPSGKRNYMRLCPADDIQGIAQANWASGEQTRTKAYVLHDQSLYGQGVAAVFRNQFQANGGEVLGFEGYDPKASDYQSLMTSVADSAPDILMLGATVENNASKVLQDMRSVMGEEVLFIGSDGLNNAQFVEAAGDAAEGAYLTFGGLTPDKLQEQGGSGADYVTRMIARLGYDSPSSLDAYAVYAYETAVLVIQTLDKVQAKDRTQFLDAIFATEGFVSLLGSTWSFTENGDTDSATIGLAQVIDGAITFQKAI